MADVATNADSHQRIEDARTRLGLWLFLSSESLLFAGLIALYTVYRMGYGESFAQGVDRNNQLLGTLNTAVLLTSSYTVASAVHALQHGRLRRSLALVACTLLSASLFIGIKATEYAQHLKSGLGLGHFATGYKNNDAERIFFALYYGLTGIHALHVLVGIGLLSAIAIRVWWVQRNTLPSESVAAFAELVALYWHFVDLVWILLWPLFYLAGTSP